MTAPSLRSCVVRLGVGLSAGLALTLAPLGLPLASAPIGQVSSNPSANERISSVPIQIRLAASDELVPELATVTASLGDAASRSMTSGVDGSNVLAAVTATPPPLASHDRLWKVAFRVVFTAGHPISGTVRFTVPSTKSTSPSSSAGSTPDVTAPQAAPSSSAGVSRRPVIDSHTSDRSQKQLNLPLALAPVAVLALLLVTPVVVAARRRSRQEQIKPSPEQEEESSGDG